MAFTEGYILYCCVQWEKHDPWCPKHMGCLGLLSFFHGTSIHNSPCKLQRWMVYGHPNLWWDREKREAYLTLQSILMHHLQHGKWTWIRRGFYQNLCTQTQHRLNPGRWVGAGGTDVYECYGFIRWRGQPAHKKCVTLGVYALSHMQHRHVHTLSCTQRAVCGPLYFSFATPSSFLLLLMYFSCKSCPSRSPCMSKTI